MEERTTNRGRGGWKEQGGWCQHRRVKLKYDVYDNIYMGVGLEFPLSYRLILTSI